MIKIKKGFILRSLDKEYIAVAIGEASKMFNGMIRLNDTGAFYWRELEKGSTEEELVIKTLENYNGVDEITARRNVEGFLNSISIALDNYDENY